MKTGGDRFVDLLWLVGFFIGFTIACILKWILVGWW